MKDIWAVSMRQRHSLVGKILIVNSAETMIGKLENFPARKSSKVAGKGLIDDGLIYIKLVRKERYKREIIVKKYELRCPNIDGAWKNEFKASLASAIKQADDFIKEREKEDEKLRKEREKEEKKRLEEKRKSDIAACTKFNDSVVAKEAFRLVHGNKYITEGAILGILRGTSYNTFYEADAAHHEGCFNDIPADEISKTIRKMIRDGIFYEKTLEGKYADFDILNSSVAYDEEWLKYTPPTITKIRSKVKKKETLNYYEAVEYVKSIAVKEELAMPDYLNLLHMTNTLEFWCLHKDEYLGLFADSPKEFKEYLKMMRESTEDRRERKIYKEIIEVIRDSKKKIKEESVVGE